MKGQRLVLFLVVVCVFSVVLFVPSAQALTLKYLRNNSTGGDCTAFGTWNNSTRTCTLTTDINLINLVIADDGITLNGAGHSMTGSGHSSGGRGIDMYLRNNVIIKNLTLSSFYYGIYSSGGANISSVDNHFSDDNYGTYFKNLDGGALTGNEANCFLAGLALDGSRGVTISGNTAAHNNFGIELMGSTAVPSTGNTVRNNITNQNATGIYLINANTNAVYDNTSGDNTTSGINLYTASNNTVRDNTFSHAPYGVVMSAGANGNSVMHNQIVANGTMGIKIDASSQNTCAFNSISGNGTGYGADVYFASDNLIYNNDFSTNATQLYSFGGSGNIFNQPAPVGGNHYDNFDTPEEGCYNLNGDGFCDSPFVFGYGQDNLPWTSSIGWCTKPPLSLRAPQPYWATYADYEAGNLSVDWTIRNISGLGAFRVELTSSAANKGVTLLTALPVPFGDIAGNASSTRTVRYHVPAGVHGWLSTNHASASDGCGSSYTYP